MPKDNRSTFERCPIIKSNTGFTLVEILVVMGLIAIIIAVAIPNVTIWRQNAQLTGIARDIYGSLQEAKVEAIKRRENCAIIFYTDKYVVYVDANPAPPGSPDFDPAGEEVIKTVFLSDYGQVMFDTSQGGGDGLTFINPTDGFAFYANGLPINKDGVMPTGKIYLKHVNNKTAIVTVSPAGSIRLN